VETGTVIGGRYTVERLLGGGAIADVYLAHDRILDAQVALKVLHAHLRESQAVTDAFRREVAVSRLLDHPSVARTHDVGVDAQTGAVYLTMEYFPGGDLKRLLLGSGRLEPEEVARLGEAVLGALEAAHDLGIVHRDVKPHNVLLDERGGYHLADFGLARSSALFGLESGMHVAGTPEYLAPESAESGYADARSDVYSLGVVLYEASTGSPPFRARSAYELVRLHATQAPEPPSSVVPGFPAGLERAILRALEKDPAHRFQTAGEFRAALRAEAAVALPAAASAHPCPSCGEPVSDGFPYCFSCRRAPLILAPSTAPRARRWRVVVTGPGKPGDQLGHELRQRCLEVLRDLEADARRLERHLPRVPFIALADLDADGARDLVARLAAAGLEATALEQGGRDARRTMRRLFAKKDALLSGRLYAVAAASSGGLFSGIGRSLARPGVALPVVSLLALGALVVPVVTIVRDRMPEVRWRGGRGLRAMKRYLELAPAIRNPALESLTRRVVLGLQELRSLARTSPAAREAADAAEDLAIRAADWIEACQLVEDRLGDERLMYREVAKLAGAGGKVAAANRSLDSRRELERAREVLLDRILEFSSRLDRLRATLGSLGARDAERDLRELGKAAEEASVAVSAVREVEEAVP
jgi:hypothetical protein